MSDPGVELANKIDDEDARKYKISKFVHQKKMKNALKYDDTSKLNDYAMPVPKGTVSIMLNTQKRNNGFVINNPNKKLTVKARFKIKWKAVQWLAFNKQEAVRTLLHSCKKIYGKFIDPGASGRVDQQVFSDMLRFSGIGGDPELNNKLF